MSVSKGIRFEYVRYDLVTVRDVWRGTQHGLYLEEGMDQQFLMREIDPSILSVYVS